MTMTNVLPGFVLDRSDVQSVQRMNPIIFANDNYDSMADGNEFRMRHVKSTSIRGVDDKWLKSVRDTVFYPLNVHRRT